MPVEIDEIQRKILQAEIEREALKKETDPASRERLAKLEDTLEAMHAQIAGMKNHWEDEKRLIQNIRKIKEAQEQLGIDEQRAEREGNLARVAELRYGRSSELKASWKRPIRIWKRSSQTKRCSKRRWMTRISPR